MGTEAMNIYQRINAVMKKVEYVQKDATVSTGGGSYRAVTHDMVLAVLRKAMVEFGIVTRPDLLRGEFIYTRGPNPKEDKSQHSLHLYQGEYAVHFVNIDQPEDCLTVTVSAHANDNGDKAPGKALSYAVKYAMLKVFGLETGENEEARFSDRPLYTPEQKERFDALLESKQALEFLCMEKQVGPDIWAALHNSFPEGKKVLGKRQATDLTKAGWEAVENTAATITGFIDSHDTGGLLETIAELNPTEKKLVAARLKPHEIDAIKKVQELAA